MSARKLIVHSITAFLLLLTITSYQLPIVYAQDNGTACTYPEEQNDGIYVCDGSYESGVCKYDPGIDPKCQKEPDASTPGTTNPTAPTPIDDKNWGPRQQNAFWQGNGLDGFGCIAVGFMLSNNPAAPDEAKKCPGDGPNGVTALYDRVPGGGALGGLGSVMMALYTNPSLSSSEYLASIGENLGIKETYAQTIGSGGSSGDAVIKPVLKLWQISRNITYVAFILVFAAVGFMIMLRSKINPQTVVTAQAALPGLVIGLILVTFSYFISALIIDLSFIGMNLIIFLFTQPGIDNAVQNPREIGANLSIFALFKGFVLNGVHLNHLVLPIKDAFQGAIPLFNTGNPIGWITGGIIGGTIGILVMFIVLIAVLVQMFRLLWELVSSYIAIFVTTVAGPFIILASSLPGRGGGMGVWWKSLLGNALVFPAVFAAFLFAGVILGNVHSEDFKLALPLFAGLPVEILRVIIAYGIILGTPAIPGMVKKAMGVPELAGIQQEAASGFRFAQEKIAQPLGGGAARAGAKFAYNRYLEPTLTPARARLGTRIEEWMPWLRSRQPKSNP